MAMERIEDDDPDVDDANKAADATNCGTAVIGTGGGATRSKVPLLGGAARFPAAVLVGMNNAPDSISY